MTAAMQEVVRVVEALTEEDQALVLAFANALREREALRLPSSEQEGRVRVARLGQAGANARSSRDRARDRADARGRPCRREGAASPRVVAGGHGPRFRYKRRNVRPQMVVVAGPPGSGKSLFFPVGSLADAAFNVDDRAAELNGGSYRKIPRAGAAGMRGLCRPAD
jgi:hypothetical protein